MLIANDGTTIAGSVISHEAAGNDYPPNTFKIVTTANGEAGQYCNIVYDDTMINQLIGQLSGSEDYVARREAELKEVLKYMAQNAVPVFLARLAASVNTSGAYTTGAVTFGSSEVASTTVK